MRIIVGLKGPCLTDGGLESFLTVRERGMNFMFITLTVSVVR